MAKTRNNHKIKQQVYSFLVSNSWKKNRAKRWFLFGLKVVKIARRRATTSFLSGLKFVKVAKNRETSSFLSALKFLKIAKNRELTLLYYQNSEKSSLKFFSFWSQIPQGSQKESKTFQICKQSQDWTFNSLLSDQIRQKSKKFLNN